MEGLYRVRRSRLRQIQKGQVSDQNHILFIFRQERSHRSRIRLLSKPKHTHAPLIQFIRALFHLFAHLPGQRYNLSLILRKRADFQHFLDGSLGDKLGLPILFLYHDAHAAAFKVKGNLVNLCINLIQILKFRVFGHKHLRTLNDGPIQKILKARLIPAVQERVTQNPVVLLPVYVQVTLQNDLILG